jgi:hypothetical protein
MPLDGGTRSQNITFGEMRESGVSRVIVFFCSDYGCSHSTRLSANRWTDHLRLSDIEPQFVCQACGKRGADVRPLFEHARMGTGRGRPGLAISAPGCSLYRGAGSYALGRGDGSQGRGTPGSGTERYQPATAHETSEAPAVSDLSLCILAPIC